MSVQVAAFIIIKSPQGLSGFSREDPTEVYRAMDEGSALYEAQRLTESKGGTYCVYRRVFDVHPAADIKPVQEVPCASE